MDINLEVLNRITETAVKAAGYRDITQANGNRIMIRPDGDKIEIPCEPDPFKNSILTIEDAVKLFHGWPLSGLWIDESQIVVVHDDKDRMSGYSTLALVKSPAARVISAAVQNNKPVPYTPVDFERICKLYFQADTEFIKLIRTLKWRGDSNVENKITIADKSMSANAIKRVLDANNQLFEDILLLVKFPYYVCPIETATCEVKLNIVANAESQTFCFEPFPGVMEDINRKALREVRQRVDELITESERERVHFGTPISVFDE